MTFLRSLAAAGALLSAPMAHAVPSLDIDVDLDYAAGSLFAVSDPGEEADLSILVSVASDGSLGAANDDDFVLVLGDDLVLGRPTALSAMFGDGSDAIRLTFAPTLDESGVFGTPFYTTLTGEFGEGFGSAFFDTDAAATISAIPLPAGGLLLLGGLGTLALRRRA